MAKIGFISLGCAKNLVDSERILSQLRAEGYQFSHDYQDADLVIINTCGFIEAAIEESITTIQEAIAQNGRVLVTGCLGKQADLIRQACPQVLDISPAHAYEQVMQQVHAHLPPPPRQWNEPLPSIGVKLTPAHYAYIKIAEGCNHACRFCIIPQLRGRLQSRPLSAIVQEAENLVQAGVRELLLVSQDTSAYGLDLKYRPDFIQGKPLKTDLLHLVQALSELPAWIRLHYLYPYPQVDQLIPLMAEGLLLPYLDVPLQHASPRLLSLMGRPAASEKMLQRIEKWRQTCPEITLRSTFIVGFPGETEEDFQILLDFIEQAQLDRVGCFTYSPVAGAAANQLPNPVPEEVKQERQQRLMALQAQISAQKLQAKIGQHSIVLIDEVLPDRIIARSPADAPEVDGQVIIAGEWEGVRAGDFIEVRITAADAHDLYAQPLD